MENVCRLCLSDDEPKLSVFGTQETPVSLATKILVCLSIQISATDRLSTQICTQCVKTVNQWYNYKEACFRSQVKLHQWLERHLRCSPMVATIKDEPVDLDFCEDNIEVISESNVDSDVETTNIKESLNDSINTLRIQEITDDEADHARVPPTLAKDLDICIKPKLAEDYDTDCTIEIESVTGSELVLNPLSNKEDRVMKADSRQKSRASTSASKKKMRRGPHTHYRGIRAFKQKCVHCQIFLHSKYSYTKHMERFHTGKQNGDADEQLKDEEEVEETEKSIGEIDVEVPLPYKNGDPVHNHICDLCGMIYRYRPNMLKHRDMCQRLQPEFPTSYKCMHCGMTYLVFKKFHNHITIDHKKKDFFCSECGAKFRSPSEYLTHHEMHRGKPKKKPALERNEPSTKTNTEAVCHCPQGLKTFAIQANLNLHFQTAHKNKKSGGYECDICGKAFMKEASLKIHRGWHNRKNSRLNLQTDFTELRKHLWDVHCSHKTEKPFAGEEFTCDICNNIFPDKETLNMHMEWHKSENEKPMLNQHMCNICNKIFCSKQSLQRHRMNLHSVSSNQQTMFSGTRRMPQEGPIVKNMKLDDNRVEESCHVGKKPVMCHVCGKFFANMSVLYKHNQLMHSKSRPTKTIVKAITTSSSSQCIPLTGDDGKVSCNVCCKSFSAVSNLRQHFAIKHKNSPPKFACPIDGCKLMFPSSAALRAHELWSHTSMICN